MNIKLHTPKSLKSGSGMATLKQFLMSIVATSISIILTFGTAYFVDKHKKESERTEMIKVVLYDFDKTISQIERADTVFQEASRIEQELAEHPEYYDSLRFSFRNVSIILNTKFSPVTEKIFSSNIETVNTLGSVNLISEISRFYMERQYYEENGQQKRVPCETRCKNTQKTSIPCPLKAKIA